MRYNYFVSFLLCHILFFAVNVEAQEWDNLPVQRLSWSQNDKLTFYNYSNTDLSVWNSNVNTAESGRWKSEETGILFSQLSQIKYNRGFAFSFSIRNDNNNPSQKYRIYNTRGDGRKEEAWHEDNIYWGFRIDMSTINNSVVSYTQYISDRKTPNSKYNYTDLWNSDRQSWVSGEDITTRHYMLEYDGGNTAVLLFSQDGTNYEPIKQFNNVKAISRFSVVLGSAAYVNVTNLSYNQITDYGLAKPDIDRAIEEYDKENYSGAISIISRLLNRYKSSLVYFIRGRSYSMRELYAPALEDYTSALSYSCDDELRRSLYFNRGICRFMLDDYENGILDMRNAGEEGIAFLKEHGLDDFNPDRDYTVRKGNNSTRNNGSNYDNSLEEAFQIIKKGQNSSTSNNRNQMKQGSSLYVK